jgi:RNA polymerase sigma factor (sigma-70 family)
MDVFNEVYVRANRQIKLGNNISNLSAWFSVVALNVIREWSRREQRQEAFLSSYEFYTDAYSVDSSAELMDLSDMLEKLDPADRELLISRARGKSWREIAQEFIGKENDKGNLQSVTSKLMQRHSRLIQRLRRQYRLNQSKNSNYPTADK